MLPQEENERLTRVGPGTPMGNLFRRYWHPVAASVELDEEPTKAVRILGENLVLYKDRGGRLGLLGQQCSHRKTSLEYGIPEAEGLRCPYHGWLYDAEGRCLEQPAEPPESNFNEKIQHPAYPVQELGGLVWAYLGPAPAPLLPRFDIFVWEDAIRDVGVADVPCNWLQIMENSVDLTHVDYLHGLYLNYMREREGKAAIPTSDRVYNGNRHAKIGFDLFEFGIIKRRMMEGEDENSRTWKEGTSPLIFPNITSAVGFQIRVPIDDQNTRMFLYSCYRPNDGQLVPQQDVVPVYEVPYKKPNGKFQSDWVTAQDIMAMTTQGLVMDRSDEKLGASDQGLIFFRKVLMDQIARMEDGADPLGVLRDPQRNVRIDLPRGGADRGNRSTTFMDTHWHQFSPIYDEAKALLTRGKAREPVGR